MLTREAVVMIAFGAAAKERGPHPRLDVEATVAGIMRDLAERQRAAPPAAPRPP